MLSLFYRSNFCAECGNDQDARKPWWGHPYLCRDCTRRTGAYKRMLPIVAVLLILLIAAIGRRSSSGPEVSAVNTIVNPEARKNVEIQKPQKVQCGAKTRKGTPCKHLALPGERCAQHKGQVSMLDGK